jgi:sec-independent protein translocase protein TatC
MALKLRRRRGGSEASMTILQHLSELRSRLMISFLAVVVGTAIAWPLYRLVFNYLSNPYCSFIRAHPSLAVNPDNPCQLVFLTVLEPFLIKLKVVVFLGLALALPVVLYEFWRFVTPGLMENERRLAIPFVAASVVLFALGGWFAMLALPKALAFLLGFAGTERVTTVLSISKYIGFVMLMIAGFGVSFEFPVVLLSLVSVGVLSSRKLRDWRRGAILLIALFAAVLTPSQDWFTMSAMMVPMMIFYELSILVARFLMKK